MPSGDWSASTIEELRNSPLNGHPWPSWPRDHESRLQAVEAKLGIKPAVDPRQAPAAQPVYPDFGPYSHFHNAIIRLVKAARADGLSVESIVVRLIAESYSLDPPLAENSLKHEKAMDGLVRGGDDPA
jgi:hypothetical protein